MATDIIKDNTPLTSSGDGSDKAKTTGDSEVQDGSNVENEPIDKNEEQQEFIEQANDNTDQANENPVKDGKGLTMAFEQSMKDEDDDEDEDDDDDDNDNDALIIGDDPGETKKKIPVM